MSQPKMKPIVDPEDVFPSVENMIYSQAWKFANTYPISFEEAKEEAYYAFVKSCYDYNPKRGQKFSTWCYYWVWCKLKDLITARTTDPHMLLDPIGDTDAERRHFDEILGPVSQLSEDFNEMMEDVMCGLSAPARDILSLLLAPPPVLLRGERPTPKQLMFRVKKHLMKRKGVAKEEFQKAFNELEVTLKPILQ